jgi:hypothetical protein
MIDHPDFFRAGTRPANNDGLEFKSSEARSAGGADVQIVSRRYRTPDVRQAAILMSSGVNRPLAGTGTLAHPLLITAPERC